MLHDVGVLLPGLLTTLTLWVCIMAIGIPLGLAMGYALNEGPRLVAIPVFLISQVGRGFPALVTLYLVYFGLPEFDVALAATTSVVIAFSLTTASYLAEVFRAALAGVPKGLREASQALGVPWGSRMVHIILPKALRSVAAPVIGFAAIVLQATALGYSVGARELLGISYSEGTVTFSVFRFLVIAGLFYLFAYLVLIGTSHAVRRRADRSQAPAVHAPA